MSEEYCRRQIFPLRLSPSMRHQASNLAHREGISLNHFVSLAIAEKITRMEEGLWATTVMKRKPESIFAPHLARAKEF
jgi:hypothetical protein